MFAKPMELQMGFAGGANGREPRPMELQMASRPTSERARRGVNAPLERHEIRSRITEFSKSIVWLNAGSRLNLICKGIVWL